MIGEEKNWRLFVGLPLPADCRKQISDFSSELRKNIFSRLSWTSADNLHVTLKFLGDTPVSLLEDLKESLLGISFPEFDLHVKGGGFFPDVYKPRVLWLGAEKGGRESSLLAGEIDRAGNKLGFSLEKKPFHPHLTLGRVKKIDSKDDWKFLENKLQGFHPEPFRVRQFVLWKSELMPKGSIYHQVCEIDLLPE